MALALISGGSGMIGKALSRWLLTRGHRVVVLTRDSHKQPAYGESAVWDGVHPGIWMDWVQQADWIINLAGENIGASRWTEKRLTSIRDSRVLPGELLTEAILRSPHRPSIFLQMSAIPAHHAVVAVVGRGGERTERLHQRGCAGVRERAERLRALGAVAAAQARAE